MWGQPGITKKMRLSNGTSSWGNGSIPVSTPIARGDILRSLQLYTSGTLALTPGTGTIAADVHGPYNQYSNINIGPSNSAKILNVSGYGLYLINLMRAKEHAYASYDADVVTVQNAADFTDVYTLPTTGTKYDNTLEVPVAQLIKSMGVEVGLWQLSEQTMNMVLNVTPASASSASPYNIYSTTAGALPYLTTGNATVTLATPTMDVLRYLYKNPVNAQDYPPFDFVSVWTEDNFTNALTKAPVYTFPTNSGLLARACINAFDATAGNGAAMSTYFAANNAFSLLYGTSDTKDMVSGYELQASTAKEYGFLMPKGVFAFDWLGTDLTLSDVLNTSVLLNVRFVLALGAALPASSTLTVDYQLLQPIVAG